MKPQPLRGRPTRVESEAIERRIREVAIDAFATNGFEGTTMEAVAAGAGITKRTLYAKYPDKQALFAAVIPQALADMPFHDLELTATDTDLAAALRSLSDQILTRLTEPRAVQLRRLATLEAARLAKLHRTDSDLWSTSLRSVVDLLSVHAAAGTIIVDDLESVADLFLAMVAGTPTMWADYGIVQTPLQRRQHIDRAVDLLLAGILPRR
jgi:TetR/AcrR family transcriptional repressor of mexJK operon